MSASPLQVTAAFAALADGGIYHPPTIIQRVIDSAATPARARPAASAWSAPRPPAPSCACSRTSSTPSSAPARTATIDGYRVAGKTSTAQKSGKTGYDDGQYYSSFVGAVPARAPRIVMLVSVDSPEGAHFGNDVAAPSFARLGAQIMVHLGVPRDDGSAPPPPPKVTLAAADPRLIEGFLPDVDVEPDLPGQRRTPVVTSRTGLPDFTGLTLAQALDLAQSADVELRAVGSGIAVLQDQEPGPVASGTPVQVFFEPPT
jgi:cell division protein FtsI (penicillin-binding protein 3)